MTDMDTGQLICDKCRVNLEPDKIILSYMGFQFTVDIPKCPVCGLVYLSEELVKGKVADLEKSLEDK